MTRTILRFAVALSACLTSISLGIQTHATEAGSKKYDPPALYLTWQSNPTTTMTIRWHSRPRDSCASVVKYQRFNETAWDSVRGCPHPMVFSDRIVHVVELKGLMPDKKYRFRLGQDSTEYKFRTMPDSLTEKVRFVVGGDTYGRVEWFWQSEQKYSNLLRKTNKKAAEQLPMFVVIGGDFTYSDGQALHVERWYKWLKAWKKDMVTCDGLLIPLVPVIGNHETFCNIYKNDWYKPNKSSVPIRHRHAAHTTPLPHRYKPNKPFDPAKHAPYFYNLFIKSGSQPIKSDSLSYRALKFGNYMSLILLDSGHTYFVSEQAEWLADTLEAWQEIPYKFAAYHVPAYPSARDPDDEISTRIRKCWIPIFEHWKLDVAFEHHDHTYKRTLPIQKNRYHPKGVVYLGDGAWGKLRNPKPNRWYLAKAEKKYHFILVTLTKDKAMFQAIDNEGQVFDEYCKLRGN